MLFYKVALPRLLTRLDWVDGYLIAALSFPLIGLFSGVYQLFPTPGWVDPSIYLSYFLSPHANLENFGPVYYSSRLSFIVPGYLFNSILNYKFATYALVVFFDLLGLLSIYYLSRKAAGVGAAVVATWWMGCNPLWISAISGGYVDGPAISYALTALSIYGVSTELGRKNCRPAMLVVVGAFLSLSLLSHPVPAGITGLAVLTASLLSGGRYSLGRFLLWGGLGFISILLAAGLVMVCFGGPFFFVIDRSPVANALAGRAQIFMLPPAEWIPSAYRLVMPVAVALLCLVAWWARGNRGAQKWSLYVGLGLLAATALFLGGWDIAVRGITLQSHFYSSYLLLGQSIAVIGFLALCKPVPSEGPQIHFRLFLTALALTVLVALALQETIASWGHEASKLWCFLIGLLILAAALAALKVSQGSIWLLFCLTLIAGIANADTRKTFISSRVITHKDLFQHLVRIKSTTDALKLEGRRVALWLDRSEYTTGDTKLDESFVYKFYIANSVLRLNLFDSLAGFWLWDRGTLNFEMPNLRPYNIDWLKRKNIPTTIVMVCIYPSTCNRGHAALEDAGVPTQVRSQILVGQGSLQPITILAVDYQL